MEVGINRKPVCDFILVINSNILSHTVSELSQLIVEILDTAFLSPLPCGDNVRCSSWAHWNSRSGLDLVLIELYSLRVTAEALYGRKQIENRRFSSNAAS